MRCYICNRELVDNSHGLNPKFQSVTHDEHILHAAIGGRLKSNKILCKECGSKFGGDDDSGFVKLFFPFTNILKEKGYLNAAHGDKKMHKTSGVLYINPSNFEDKIEIILKQGHIYAKDNTYRINKGAKTIDIYLCTNRNDSLIENVKHEITAKETSIDINDYCINIYDIIDSKYIGWYFSENNPDFNKHFGKGLQKIATEYALDCGTNREQLTNVLCIDNNGCAQLTEEVECIPFFPNSLFDCMYELSRSKYENFFPTHTLILFDQYISKEEHWLFCYVDLFSTFQYYVVLSKKYSGESICKTYHQQIKKKILNPEYIDDSYDYSDIDIIIRELNIDISDIPRNRSEMIDYINREIKRKADSGTKMDNSEEFYDRLAETPDKIIKSIFTSMISTSNDVLCEDVRALLPFWLNEGFELSEELEKQTKEGVYKSIIANVFDGEIHFKSMPIECEKVWKNNPDMIKQYTHAKFNTLYKYLHDLEPIK